MLRTGPLSNNNESIVVDMNRIGRFQMAVILVDIQNNERKYLFIYQAGIVYKICFMHAWTTKQVYNRYYPA